MYGFLFFTACVMDAFAIQTGQAVCNDFFASTSLGEDIQSKSLTLTCNSRYVTSNTYILYTVHASINTYIHTYIHTKQWRGLFHYIKYFSYFLWCILRTYIQYISSSVWYVRKYIHTYIQYVTHIDTYTRLFGYLFRSVHTYNHFYMHSFLT